MAQLLFAMPRARNDIHKLVVFLTMRMQELENYDWYNLRQVLKYLRRKIYMPLILRDDSLNVIKWWVDA